MPIDHGSQDLSHWRTRLAITDLERTMDQVASYGGQVVGEAVTLGAGEAASLGFRRGVTVLDPDGHSLQLVET
jgi:predicted enzyme related to lactoylglutathione lyase